MSIWIEKLRKKVTNPVIFIDYFKKFTLDGWTLTWPNDADIAPQRLYELALQE